MPARLDGLEGDAERVDLDVRDKDGLVSLLKGVDEVFHLAAVNGTENFYNRPELVLDVGVRGALAVCEACVAAGVSDLVIAYSAEEIGRTSCRERGCRYVEFPGVRVYL